MTPIVVDQPCLNESDQRIRSSFRWIRNNRNSNTILLVVLSSLTIIQHGSSFTTVQPRIRSCNSFTFLLQSSASSTRPAPFATRLYASSSKLEPLVQAGDWSAYLDEDRTGLIYYFNSRTGESSWEPPTPDFPIVTLTPALRAKAQMKQNEYVQQIELEQVQRQQTKQQQEQQQKLQQQQQQKKETKKNRFFLSTLLSDDEEEDDEIEKETSSASATTKQVQKKKETSDWFNSVVQDVIQKQPSETTSKRSFEQDRLALGDRLKNDFFDKMFSSGKNAVTGVTNAISSTVGDIATLTSSTNTASSTSVTPTDEEEATATATSSSSSGIVTPEPVTKQPEPKTATRTAATTTTAPTTTIPAPAIVVPETRTVEVVSLVLPHPEKVRWGGEDAVFVNGRTFGLFDGVSGAKKRDGVPLYSKTLANYMKQQSKSYQSIGMTIPEMSNLLLSAAEYADEKATGASTALVASITSDGFLRVLSVGDSRCVLIRNGIVIAKSREISHYFECPYQLSVDSPDRPRDGTKLNIELQKNDLIIMASDGVFDNLSEERILEIINEITSSTSNSNNAAVRKNQLQKIAKRIVDVSRKVSFDTKAITPYAKLAKRNNQPEYSDGLGGKIDDISCIVARYE